MPAWQQLRVCGPKRHHTETISVRLHFEGKSNRIEGYLLNLLLFLLSLFPAHQKSANYSTIFKLTFNQSHIQTTAALLQVNIVLILQTIAHYKRRTNELLNLLASVSVTSSQKEAKEMRKKRKPTRFSPRPGRTGKWWQNFLDNDVILEEWIENFRLSKETCTELCDDQRAFLTKSDTTMMFRPFSLLWCHFFRFFLRSRIFDLLFSAFRMFLRLFLGYCASAKYNYCVMS